MISPWFHKIRPTVHPYFVDISAMDDVRDPWLSPQIARAPSPLQRSEDDFATPRTQISQPAPDPVITDPE